MRLRAIVERTQVHRVRQSSGFQLLAPSGSAKRALDLVGQPVSPAVPYFRGVSGTFETRVNVLLISTYELGTIPSVSRLLKRGWCARASGGSIDLAVERIPDPLPADLIAFYLPMHTATRLALPVIERVKRAQPARAPGCLRAVRAAQCGAAARLGVDGHRRRGVRAGSGEIAARRDRTREFRSIGSNSSCPTAPASLGRVRASRSARRMTQTGRLHGSQPRLQTSVPALSGGARVSAVSSAWSSVTWCSKIFGAGRGGRAACHLRRSGFLQRPHACDARSSKPARRISRVTYDATIKIEHLLKHRDLLPALRETGCLFVTSAVESVDDAVLQKLEKNHTRRDFFEASELMREAG